MIVSIVVPTYNRKEDLEQCLNSIFKQNFDRNKYELIVIDDGSSDGTRDLIKKLRSKFPIKYFYQKNQGPAAARNLGIKKAKGEIMAFIDSDCVADKDWLVNLVKGFNAERKIAGVGGQIRVLNPQSLIEKYADIFLFNHQECIENAKEEPPHMGTLNCAYKVGILKKIGLFDTSPSLIYGEDLDLCWRLYFSGYKLGYSSKAIVFHQPETLVQQLRKNFIYGSVKCKILKKHQEKLKKDYNSSLSIFQFFFRDLINLFTLPKRIINRFRKIPAKYRKEKPFWFFILMLFTLDILIYQGFRLGMVYQVIKLKR